MTLIKKILIVSGFSLLLLSAAANARVAVFAAPGSEPSELCQNIVGKWAGKARLVSMFADCFYEGTTTVSGKGNLTAATDFHKIDGPNWCETQIKLSNEGFCNASLVDFNHQNIQLSGKTSGHHLEMDGTVQLALDAYLEVSLHKLGR